jgi:hypothetical protein
MSVDSTTVDQQTFIQSLHKTLQQLLSDSNRVIPFLGLARDIVKQYSGSPYFITSFVLLSPSTLTPKANACDASDSTNATSIFYTDGVDIFQTDFTFLSFLYYEATTGSFQPYYDNSYSNTLSQISTIYNQLVKQYNKGKIADIFLLNTTDFASDYSQYISNIVENLPLGAASSLWANYDSNVQCPCTTSTSTEIPDELVLPSASSACSCPEYCPVPVPAKGSPSCTQSAANEMVSPTTSNALYTLQQCYPNAVTNAKIYKRITESIIPILNTQFQNAVNQIVGAPSSVVYFWEIAKKVPDGLPLRWDEEFTIFNRAGQFMGVNPSGDNPVLNGAVTTWKLEKINTGFVYPNDAATNFLTGLPATLISTSGQGALSTTPASSQARKPCLQPAGGIGIDEIWSLWASGAPTIETATADGSRTTPNRPVLDKDYVYLVKSIDPKNARTLGDLCAQYVVEDITMRDSDNSGVYGIFNFLTLSNLSQAKTSAKFPLLYTLNVQVKTLSYVGSSLLISGPPSNLMVPSDNPNITFEATYSTDNNFIINLDCQTTSYGIKTNYPNQIVEMSLKAPGPLNLGAAISNVQFCANSDLKSGNIQFALGNLTIQFENSTGVCKSKQTCPFLGTGESAFGNSNTCTQTQVCTTWNSNANADSFSVLTFGKGPQKVVDAIGGILFDKINTALLSISNSVSIQTVPISFAPSS